MAFAEVFEEEVGDDGYGDKNHNCDDDLLPD